VTVGEPAWSGEQFVAFSYPYSSANVSGNAATLCIWNTADVYLPLRRRTRRRTRCSTACRTISRIRISTARENGRLRCVGGPSNTIAVSGFATNDLVVWDVTATTSQSSCSRSTVAWDAASWRAAFACGGTDRVYCVFSKSAGVSQPAVRGVCDVNWSSPPMRRTMSS